MMEKTWLPELEGYYEAHPKTFVWQLLDGKHDKSILSETVSRPETQFLMLIVTAVFQAEMHCSVWKWVM